MIEIKKKSLEKIDRHASEIVDACFNGRRYDKKMFQATVRRILSDVYELGADDYGAKPRKGEWPPKSVENRML